VKVLVAWSAYVAEAASLYRNSELLSCSDALIIKPSTGNNDVIVNRVDERNFRRSLRLFNTTTNHEL